MARQFIEQPDLLAHIQMVNRFCNFSNRTHCENLTMLLGQFQLVVFQNKKGAPKNRSALMKTKNYFLTPRIASFAALATRNFTTRLALIWMASPVLGLRPMRAARSLRTSLPMPGNVKVSFACL